MRATRRWAELDPRSADAPTWAPSPGRASCGPASVTQSPDSGGAGVVLRVVVRGFVVEAGRRRVAGLAAVAGFGLAVAGFLAAAVVAEVAVAGLAAAGLVAVAGLAELFGVTRRALVVRLGVAGFAADAGLGAVAAG